MPNIYDIARASGFSKTTISRVINNSPFVNEETKQKVLEIMREQNYTPNSTARSLALHKNYVVGVIGSDFFEDGYTSMLFKSIWKSLNQYGYGSLFWLYNDKAPNDKFFELMYGKVDGIIVASQNCMPLVYIQKYVLSNIPTVLFDSYTGIEGITEVNVDNYGGAFTATEHLLKLGHRKIGHIYGLPYKTSDMRLLGYRDALEKYNVPFSKRLVIQGDYSFQDAYKASDILIKEGVTAVFAGNDNMALGFIAKAKEMGYIVPRDISVIGFDDINSQGTALTSMRQPLNQISQYIAECIINKIDTGCDKGSIVIPVTLSDKGSTSKLT